MKQASCIEIELPLAARVDWLLQQYPHFVTHPDLLKQKLGYLKSRYGGKKIAEWCGYINAGQWHTLVGDLLTHHYDPAYRHSIGHTYGKVEKTLQIADLSETSIEGLLDVLLSVK
jgi:tRNA 2-selenouridine synthase